MRLRGANPQGGFSLIELLVVVAVFTLVSGAVFALLDTAQQRYRMESEFLDTFQGGRLALDQLARDVHSAGYPPANSFFVAPAPNRVAETPFAWTPGYPGATCGVGADCTSPGNFDLIVEADLDPQNNDGVEWIRYRLNGTTLERGEAAKVAGADPAATTLPTMVPYVENVMNNATPAQMAQIQAAYPAMFPGNNPVPIFTYRIDTGAPNTPPNIREVNVTLIVMAPHADPRTRQPRVVTLTGRARRINPSQ